MLTTVERLKRDVNQYRADLEDPIIRESRAADACADFEYKLQKGLCIYRALNRLDENLRLQALKGEIEYTAEIADGFRRIFALWHEPCGVALKSLQYFEDRGFVVENANEFRAACIEVTGMLAGDAEFFSGNALADLRDEAVESFRRGECEEMKE